MGRKVGLELAKRKRDERIYSENEAKGERGPLVVTGLLCVSVEKKHATREASAGIISAFRRQTYEFNSSNWQSRVASHLFIYLYFTFARATRYNR